jgi:hypothetical protein
MIIDAHAHLDADETFGWTDTPEKLLAIMDDAGIRVAVVTTYGDTPGPSESLERLRGWVAAHPDRLVGFPRMDPRWEDAVDIFERAVVEDGMGGLKLHPVSNISSPFGDRTVELLDRAADLGVPVLFHSGDRVNSLPTEIGEAAARTDATIMIGHVGGYFNHREALETARRHENVLLESSAFPHLRILQEAVDELGADRVIYGSDMPPANPTVEIEKIRLLEITDEQRDRILYRNAVELLGLDPGALEGGDR